MDKQFLLNKSKTFCMYPWSHLMVTPEGQTFPCCVAVPGNVNHHEKNPILGNTREQSLQEMFHSEEMNNLRKDILNEKENFWCTYCYEHEKYSPHSFRSSANHHLGKFFDDVVPLTRADGSVPEFRMRYLDVRFSNVCNFKCRLCGSAYSSQWAAETRAHGHPEWQNRSVIIHADESNDLLNEVLEHVPYIELAYFAGGEPLMNDEHYMILEEMIRQGRNEVVSLRYNTNCSVKKYRQKDIMDLWSHFKSVEISASLDHYGERAEYIRHGTNWGDVESNLKLFTTLPNMTLSVHSVISMLNYVTYADFLDYLTRNIINTEKFITQSHALTRTPEWFCVQNLPEHLKKQTEPVMLQFMNDCPDKFRGLYADRIPEILNFVNAQHGWDTWKEQTLFNIHERDAIRGEDFNKVFPELESLGV